MLDSQHSIERYAPTEVEHRYGDHVHIVANPMALSQLATLCSEETLQPTINDLVKELYRSLLGPVINQELPKVRRAVRSRMCEVLERDGDDPGRGLIEAVMLDQSTPVVTVDIARAGILPSLTCYEILNRMLDPRHVRQDHLIVSRAVNASDEVVGAHIAGDKIGGPIDGRIVLFPDPMGATGSSLSTAIQYYKSAYGGQALKLITLNLIFTPEFIRRIKADHPEVIMYALRLDRGMSSADVLTSIPGSRWDEECGLNGHGYIVPGGGGFGEIMNNAWI